MANHIAKIVYKEILSKGWMSPQYIMCYFLLGQNQMNGYTQLWECLHLANNW